MSGKLAVHRLRSRLDSTFNRIPPPAADIEVQADFAKYLCVLVSGFLENALIEMVLGVVQNRSGPEAALFIGRRLDRWSTPTADRIVNLLGDFSPTWRDAANAYLVDERKATVNSLVALRNKIAHGESVGTSLVHVRTYYATVLEVVEFVENLLEPPSKS